MSCCEQEKKVEATSSVLQGQERGYSLEAFRERLQHLCADDLRRAGSDRACLSQNQAQQACAIAREFGILKSPGISWADFTAAAADLHFGSEHAVELADKHDRVVKITIPPFFGFTPCLRALPIVDLRQDPALSGVRRSLEFHGATPLEYLGRWADANEVFGDDVNLASVISWSDGLVSFAITQPQYHGEPAQPREIDRFFMAASWQRLPDSSGHTLYYHYGFQVLAIDVIPRNCYVSNGAALPFDVILCRPSDELEEFLGLYPA